MWPECLGSGMSELELAGSDSAGETLCNQTESVMRGVCEHQLARSARTTTTLDCGAQVVGKGDVNNPDAQVLSL